MPLKPERRARLEEYAKRRGQAPAPALDDALAADEGETVFIFDIRAGRRQAPKHRPGS